ncbi:MAG TPA: ATP-binding protein, partial [Burkholderiaceae bacterium]|nr:ATP-binding protein [Burkholderiaceae bacterium]
PSWLKETVAKRTTKNGLRCGTAGLSSSVLCRGKQRRHRWRSSHLIDNACRSARSAVVVQAARDGAWLRIAVDDDGPGIAPERRSEVLQRGIRLDESGTGSGLGLAIVVDLARVYGGTLTLDGTQAGGLRALLRLPAAG